jgi:hypothetical protein
MDVILNEVKDLLSSALLYRFGISIPRFTAGLSEIVSYQRFTLGKSSSFTW